MKAFFFISGNEVHIKSLQNDGTGPGRCAFMHQM